jgi:hypothetical protein
VQKTSGVVLRVEPVLELELPRLERQEDERVAEIVVLVSVERGR